jgi:DNA polymerase-3 subunit epsilon
MSIKLERPIAFVDLETTGTNKETDRIIEISICVLHPNMDREIKTRRVNPGMPIPPSSTAVHGISDEDVRTCPPFSSLAKSFLDFIEGCDLGGFNSNAFDFPLLFNEYNRCGIYWDYKKHRLVDLGNIFKIREPRTLTAAVKFYLHQEHVGAHGAEADVAVCPDIFLAQLGRYNDLPRDVTELALISNHGNPLLDISGKFTHNEKGEIIFNFGPKKGERAIEHPDFLNWMVNRANFSVDTYSIAKDILDEYYQTQYAD